MLKDSKRAVERLWRMLLLLCVLLVGCAGEQASPPSARPARITQLLTEAPAGFARVLEPRDFVFPRDHGPHPDYLTEWWYYTGNLATADGRHFGYQLTFFRSALAPAEPQRASQWATATFYMAHFALTDVVQGRFHSFERFNRAALGLAGATSQPNYRVWLDDWSAEGRGPTGQPMQLHAAEDGVAIDLTLESHRPVVLQGDRGISRKGAEPGNASYYYSFPRMQTTGTVTLEGTQYQVSGLSWMDREFGTSTIDRRATGWDWFAIQLDDGSDLIYYQIRGAPPDTAFGKLMSDTGTQVIPLDQISLSTADSWTSSYSGASYPARWRIRAPDLDIELVPLVADQEHQGAFVYWEGAVRASGSHAGQPVDGYGYVELTGY